MEKRNKSLLAVFVGLLVLNLVVWLMPDEKSSISFDEDLFVVADTFSITDITFKGDQLTELRRNNQTWKVNDQHLMDQGLKNLLLNILQRIKVRRPVKLESKGGTDVTISGNEELKFTVSGNATRTQTYFTMDGQAYEVEIPGYRDYLAGIFELHPDQWRDRLVYNGSWRTIQSLTLDYVNDEKSDFEIAFSETFFEVKDVEALDSSAVVEYLNQFQYWQAGEMVSDGRFVRYDSLAQLEPLAKLTFDDINYSAPKSFFIYPKLEGEKLHLVKNDLGEMMIFDDRRMKDILVDQAYFKAK